MHARLLTRWVWPLRFSPPPLIDEATRQMIYRAAHSPLSESLLARREVQHILLGERQSTFAGRGYEFAENRQYSPGDEARFINWRVLARTGQLYRKYFYEERRPPLWLVLDRRAGMRFGTRTRLKVAQATQLALFHLFLAQGRGLQIGGVLLDQTPSWLTPAQDRNSVQTLIKRMCAACPPLPDATQASGLAAVLQQCQLQLAPGCIVIVYSDFQDLQAKDMSLLHALSQQHTVYARQIIDVSEQQLPAHGVYQFSRGDEVTVLDCADPAITNQYQQHMQQRHTAMEDWCAQTGVEYQLYRADEDLFAVR